MEVPTSTDDLNVGQERAPPDENELFHPPPPLRKAACVDEKKFDDGLQLPQSPPPPLTTEQKTNIGGNSVPQAPSITDKTPSKIPSITASGSIRKSGADRLGSSRIPSLSSIETTTTTTAETGSERRSRRIRQRSTGNILSAMAASGSTTTTSSPMKRQNSSDGLDQMNSDVNRKLHFIKEEAKSPVSRASITDRLYDDAKRKIKARQQQQQQQQQQKTTSPVRALRSLNSSSSSLDIGRSSNVMDRLYEDAMIKNSIRRSDQRREEEEIEVRLSPTRKKKPAVSFRSSSSSSLFDGLYKDSSKANVHDRQAKKEEINKTNTTATPETKKQSVLDRLYDDAKIKIESRRRQEEEEKEFQRKLEQQVHLTAEKKNIDNNGRPSVLDRLYEDAKQKFTRQAEEELQRAREAHEAEILQRKKQEHLLKDASSGKVASRLYEDGKRKLEAKREEEQQKREEEQRALMEHNKIHDRKTLEAGDSLSRLYEDGKRKIQAQMKEEEAKMKEEEERRGLKSGKKLFQPNLVSESYYQKKIKKSLEKEDNNDKKEENQKESSAVTPKPTVKKRPASSTKRSVTKKKPASPIKYSVTKKKQDDIGEGSKQRGDDNFSSEFYERLQMSEKKKNQNLARLKKETEKEVTHTPKNFHKKSKKEIKKQPEHEVDTSNVQIGGVQQVGEASSPTRTTRKSLFGGLFSKKEQSAQQCSDSLSGTASFDNETKDGGKSLGSKHSQEEGENFSSEFFERLQSMEEKKKKNLARLQEEKEKELPFKPKNFHKKSGKEKEPGKEAESSNDGIAAQAEESPNANKIGLFGGIFARKQQTEQSNNRKLLAASSFESETTKDGGKSVGSKNTQEDGKNFSSEFFDRLQTMEEKKKKNLARLQEEKEKELSFKPKNFTKKSKKENDKVSEKSAKATTDGSAIAVAPHSPIKKRDSKIKFDGKSPTRKSPTREIRKHAQDDGKNFSSEFFERLQTTEEKKAMKLARLKEEAEKELDFKPKNFHKKSHKPSSEGTKKIVDTSSDNLNEVPTSRDLFIPLDENNPSDSEKATFCCWTPF